MDCCPNLCLPPEEVERRRINRAIERQLEHDRKENERAYKLLFLGTAESGKSTFLKQIRILHGNGYSESQRMSFIRLVCQNVVTAMQTLIEAMRILRVDYADNQNLALAERLSEVQVEKVERLESWQVNAIKNLWNDHGLQDCYYRRREFHLTDSAKYYFSEMDRITAPGYIPNLQDILRVRVPTTGIIEYPFQIKGITFRMVDVGGQRSERRKWIHCMDNVISIIFLAALNEYDSVMLEDPTHNRMEESLALFKTLVEYPWFSETSFILFLNKTDLLEEKIQHSDVATYFPQYTGPPHNAKHAQKFFLELYKIPHRGHRKPMFFHYTCATDTKNAKVVFSSVKDTLFREIIDFTMS
ncbi:guanine nucleotide-binding protein subunit alpha-11-like [Corythoichthys intestinalis]|uniref:guanine nucleotide-binding protein subunit alpha-11-like n=1 Tax=Corythoichthys intestinalis TaxID=161448 RepID=UPI0025A63508|nr:guanine nucleotide-binding protein subunit alpha-11-like [Corythoichthys intestinalis]XP_061800671.1 guanine nucleotide-binding protein subunit alpha-11-like [Nerophis lumbriciformis]